MLEEFRNGKIGRITLEYLPSIRKKEQKNERKKKKDNGGFGGSIADTDQCGKCIRGGPNGRVSACRVCDILALVPPVSGHCACFDYERSVQFPVSGDCGGSAFYSDFRFEGTINQIFQGGIVSVLSDTYNVGILIFLVILGIMVCMMNQAGGSAAFGRWAARKIRTGKGRSWRPSCWGF